MEFNDEEKLIQNLPIKSAQESSDPYILAKGFFLARQYRNAVDFLEKARKSDKSYYDSDPKILLLLGQVKFHLWDLKEAKIILNKAKKHDETTKLARYYIGKIYMIEKKYRKAIIIFKSLINEYPKDYPYRVHCNAMISTCELKMGRVESSEFYTRKNEDKIINSSDLLLEHARFLMMQENWDDAANYFGEAANVDPTNSQAFFFLANLFYLHRQFSKAEEILAFGLNNAPEEINLFMLLSDIRKTQARYEDAIHLYKLALEINPKSYYAPYITYQLAECYYFLKDYSKAKERYQEILNNFPGCKLCNEAVYFLNQFTDKTPDKPNDESIENNELNHFINRKTTHKIKSSIVNTERLRIDNFPLGIPLLDLIGHKIVINFIVQYGIDISEEQLFEVRNLDHTDEWLLLYDFFGLLNLKKILFSGSIESVEKLIRAQVPMLTSDIKGMNQKFVAIIGYDNKKNAVIIVDPDYPDPIDIPWDEFNKSWNQLNNLVMIALPDGWSEMINELGITESKLHLLWIEALQAKEKGDLTEARKKCTAARLIKPDAEIIIKLETEIEIEERNYAAVLNLCEEQLSINSESFWALKYKGDGFFKLGEYQKAIEYYSKAKQIYSDCPNVHGMCGLCYQYLGNLTRAKQSYLRSLDIDPLGTDVMFNLATIYYELGSYSDAIEHLDSLIFIEPEFEDAKNLRKECQLNNTSVDTYESSFKDTKLVNVSDYVESKQKVSKPAGNDSETIADNNQRNGDTELIENPEKSTEEQDLSSETKLDDSDEKLND